MCAQFGVKQPGVALQRIAVPSPPEMNVDTLRMPVIRLQRIDSSTERRSSQPTAVAPSPTTQGSPASAQAAQHVPVYKIAQKAISPTSSNANAGASPDAAASANVFDFMSMSQDDIADDDPMREVIEKLHNENRIELKRNKRARQPGMGLAAKSKPVMKQPRKTKAPTVRQPPTAPLPPVVPSRVICSPPSHHEAGSVAAAPGQPNSIMPPPAPKVRPAVAVPLARNGAVRRNGPPHVLTKLMHQPTHQSTPIRPVQTAGAAAAADQAAAATGGPSNNNSSPWRVMDEQVPRTFYFSASTGDQLPSFSGDSIVVSINVPASQSNTTAPTNKRPADDALATGMETQKRPKVASVAADAVAAEQQLQKRLNFSEVTGSLNDSNSENIEPEHHAVQLAANKAKATRIVLGERCAVRSPLRPLAIRNVMLSPHTNSAHSSSSTDESVVFGSPTPINRLRLLSAQQRTPPPRHPPLQQPTADKTPPMQMIGQSSSNNATAIGSVSANASNASTPHANEAPDADLIDENTRTPAKATPPPVDGHRKNLSECFGFDSESEIEEAADDEPIRGQMVVNPFALRYKLKDLQKLRSTRRDSGPRRMLPPAAALPKPSAIVDVQLFKDVPAAPKQTIAKLWRQQRQPSAAVDGHSAATTSLQSVRVESTSDATGARKSSMAPESFNNFARGLERPNAPADTVEPVLFETRWPEQNNVSIGNTQNSIHITYMHMLLPAGSPTEKATRDRFVSATKMPSAKRAFRTTMMMMTMKTTK